MNIIVCVLVLCTLVYPGLAKPPARCARVIDCIAPRCPGAFVPQGGCCQVCPDCSATFCARPKCPRSFVPPGQCCAVCPNTTVCPPDTFQCNNGECLSSKIRCDGFPDCLDESDEKGCGGGPTCTEGEKLCSDGSHCITDYLRCNGNNDCDDGSDEIGCAETATTCLEGPCLNGGTCSDRMGTYVCECRTGFQGKKCEIASTTATCLDLPCLNGGTCTDLVGTYVCECVPGFQGKKCEIEVAPKLGKCPASSGVGHCAMMCDNDHSCPGNQLCCSTGCGRDCMDPTSVPDDGRCLHKGQWYNDGQSFLDECNTCRCSNGVAGCTKKGCPPGGCVHQGQWYPNGVTFKEGCNDCTCSNGFVACTDSACSLQCYHKGQWYNNGQTFLDECNTCTCMNGVAACTEKGCLTGGCGYKGEWYPSGTTFKDECNDCTCTNGAVACTEKACGNTCVFNGVVYQPGETYMNDCNTCSCRANGLSICTMMACPTLRPCALVKCASPNCTDPIIPPGACCGVCNQGCEVNGRQYVEGQRVPCREQKCGECVCRGGNVDVDRRPCPLPLCSSPIKPPGRCCHICTKRPINLGYQGRTTED